MELQTQWAEVYKPINDAEKQCQDSVQALMNDKQKAAWQEHLKTRQNSLRPGQPAPGGS